jgi:FkbM family methyltransferase
MPMEKTSKFTDLIRGFGIVPRSIFDLGAFDCSQSVELARAFPDAKVLAFECDPKLAPRCKAAIAGWNRIRLIQAAVGDQTSLVTFHAAIGGNSQCGSLLKPNGRYFEPMPTRETEVICYRIDHFLLQHPDIDPPDVVWMDVQGFEPQVVKGMGDYLDGVKLLWAEVAYAHYYEGQILAAEFDREMDLLGSEKVYEGPGIPGWFGDACYRPKKS